jgi:hypothetical protein
MLRFKRACQWAMVLIAVCLCYPAFVGAVDHWTQPASSDQMPASFAGAISIRGLQAVPGDQVSFFNAQGNLCGLYTVTTATSAGHYGPLSVSSDNCQPGDNLTVRVWDSRYQVELSEPSDVVLTPGQPSGNWISSPIPPAWNAGAAYILNISTVAVPTTHFPLPSGVNGMYVCDFTGSLTILGQAAQPGDEVAFLDRRGTLVGRAVVGSPGIYGFLHVYGDDPATPSIIEGAQPGEVLAVKVWDKSAQIEYDAIHLTLSAGQAMGEYAVPSPVPPRWSANAGYTLNVTVNASTLDTYTLSLAPGWNFVSLPLQPEYPAPDAVLAAILDLVNIIWGYDNHSKRWLAFRPGLSDQTLLAINADRGYWIHVKEGATLNVVGNLSSSAIPLEPGWNLVGYHGQEGRNPTSSLQQIGNTWSLLWGWSTGVWSGKHISQSISPVPELLELHKGKAYWIKLNSNAGTMQWVQ